MVTHPSWFGYLVFSPFRSQESLRLVEDEGLQVLARSTIKPAAVNIKLTIAGFQILRQLPSEA